MKKIAKNNEKPMKIDETQCKTMKKPMKKPMKIDETQCKNNEKTNEN